MKLNPNKTHSRIVSRSTTALPKHPLLSLCRVELENSNFLKLLVVVENKLTFEMNIRNIEASIAQKTGLIRKCFMALLKNDVVLGSFYAFILICFEYCPLFGALDLIVI